MAIVCESGGNGDKRDNYGEAHGGHTMRIIRVSWMEFKLNFA